MKFIFEKSDFGRVNIEALLGGVQIPILEAKNFADFEETIFGFLEHGEPERLELEFAPMVIRATGFSSEQNLARSWHTGG